MKILVEAINNVDMPGYFAGTAEIAADLVAGASAPAVRLQILDQRREPRCRHIGGRSRARYPGDAEPLRDGTGNALDLGCAYVQTVVSYETAIERESDSTLAVLGGAGRR